MGPLDSGASRDTHMPSSRKKKNQDVPEDAALRFLELYYPIHYKAGIGVEDALRGGVLSRHQVAILWLIHSEGEGGDRMPRKRIERSLTSWFGISGAAVTKALRSMAKPPLGLVELIEDPASGREKTVFLTAKGKRHMRKMIGQGDAFVQLIVDHLTPEEIRTGLHFFRRIADIVDEIR